MTIKITAKKMQINQTFTEFAENRINGKLSRFFNDHAEASIVLTPIREQVTLELTVRHDSMIFRSEQTAADKSDALNLAIEKIIRQIRKNKTRIEKSLKASAFVDPYADYVEEQEDFDVIKVKNIPLRPMTTDEAILQMNMLDHSFFMYQDAETALVNVVYRRDDGNYGVLVANTK